MNVDISPNLPPSSSWTAAAPAGRDRRAAAARSAAGRCGGSRAGPFDRGRTIGLPMRGAAKRTAHAAGRRAVWLAVSWASGGTDQRREGRSVRAVTWHGKRDVRVDEVPDPTIEEPTDAIIRVTSTGLCGSDLHLYEVLGAVHDRGRHPRPRADGHRRGGRRRGRRTRGRATASSSRSTSPAATASCATSDLHSQCETTQVREHGTGAALFGYTKLYGQVPGGQAEYLRVPAGAVRPDQGAGGPARRPLPLPLRRAADRLAGRRVRRRPDGRHASRCSASDRSAQMACRIAHPPRRAQVIGVDLVPERLALARAHGVEALDLARRHDDVADADPRAHRRPRPGRA